MEAAGSEGLLLLSPFPPDPVSLSRCRSSLGFVIAIWVFGLVSSVHLPHLLVLSFLILLLVCLPRHRIILVDRVVSSSYIPPSDLDREAAP